MADDALMRKNAEMGKMTEARLAWARECGRDNLPCPSDRELDAFNEGFRRAQALSLESVHEEALEKALKEIDAILLGALSGGEVKYRSEDGFVRWGLVQKDIHAALQSPARVAEGESMSVVPQDSPLMKAWEAYKTTDEYQNTRKWAAYTEHVDGSLWAAFCAGFAHSPSAPESPAKEQPE